jgi:hypothetical protein
MRQHTVAYHLAVAISLFRTMYSLQIHRENGRPGSDYVSFVHFCASNADYAIFQSLPFNDIFITGGGAVTDLSDSDALQRKINRVSAYFF